MSEDPSISEMKDAKIVRIVITKEADMALTDITSAVNSGFEAGRATKLDVASYMLLWFKEHAPEDVLPSLRLAFADDITMLESIMKKAKSSGNVPAELKEALAQYFFGNGLSSAKKVKKSLKSDGIIDRIKEGDAA